MVGKVGVASGNVKGEVAGGKERFGKEMGAILLLTRVISR